MAGGRHGRARRRPRRRARAGGRRVSTSAVGPAATIRPSRSSTSSRQMPAASGRSCVETTMRHAARAVEVGEQLRDLELRAEIERRGRLVEQQHLGGLGQRRGDHHALLLAAAERGEVAVFERGRAGRRQRIAGHREIGRALDLEQARDAGGGPSAPSPAPSSRRRAASPAARRPCGGPASRRRVAGQRPAVEAHLPAGRPARARQQPQQRRLARAVRAEHADDGAGRAPRA